MRRLAFALVLALAACGNYPQPFAGNPGRMGALLALPPPPRLVVPPPTKALLSDADSAAFATALAAALADRSVPAIAVASRGADWRLNIAADLADGGVVPTYTIVNPKGVAQGSASGAPVGLRTWSAATDADLHQIATRDAEAIAALLDRIKATVQQSDPNSLVNRPARIAMQGVAGAPGDGNAMLRRMITADLGELGIVVQDTPRGADYSLAGTVRIAPSGTPGQSRVEIQWTVHDRYGTEAGHLLQMNDVPDGSLNGHWGDVAVVVAQEAAGGVREVLTNQLAAGAKQPHPKAPGG